MLTHLITPHAFVHAKREQRKQVLLFGGTCGSSVVVAYPGGGGRRSHTSDVAAERSRGYSS